MKKILFTCCLIWAALVSYGQTSLSSAAPADTNSFQFLSKQYLDNYLFQATNPTDIARKIKMHGRWNDFWRGRVGYTATGINFGGINEILDLEMRTSASCLGGNIFRGNWTNLGPFRSYYGDSIDNNGRIVSLWVNPNNMAHILAGSGAGGLWKTIDTGRNWSNITDGVGFDVMPGTMGVTGIAVHPDDFNRIYISTGTFRGAVMGWMGSYSLGVMFSTNGGNTWNPDLQFRSVVGTALSGGWSPHDIVKMAYSPTTKRLYVIYKKRIFVKPSTTQNWTDITPTFMSNDFDSKGYELSDFEFSHYPNGRIVFSTYGTASEHGIYTYWEPGIGPAGGTWSARYVDLNGANTLPSIGIRDIDLNADDALYLHVERNGGDNDHHLYITDLDNGPMTYKSSLTYMARDVAVSHNNAELFYLLNMHGVRPFISRSITTGGFADMGGGHADGRAILIYDHGTADDGLDDIVFCGTDGGIALKKKGSYDFKSITGKGICITQHYATATSPSNDGYMTAGAHDNGNQAYVRKRNQPWSNENPDADGLVPVFSRNGVNKSVMQAQWGMHIAREFSDTLVNPMPSPINPPDNPATPRWTRPIIADKDNILRYGVHFIWQRDINNPNWDYNFGNQSNPREPKGLTAENDSLNNILIGSFLNPPDFILPEADPNVAYICYTNQYVNNPDPLYGNLFRTTDRTTFFNWENISPSLVTGCNIRDLEIDPKEPNRIWVCYENFDPNQIGISNILRKRRVIYSSDYGSNWTDVSKGLPATPILKLLYIPGSDDDIFAATDVGVYRWSKARQQWECFNNNMPKTIVTGLEFLACSGKIRASTFGRGVWESPIDENVSSLTPVGETDEITTNTTWNSSKTISGSIRIRSGATLTISGAGTTIYMPSRGKIAVEGEAKLIIDGAKITNECDGAMWLGIQLSGNLNGPPTPINQGYLELKNNARLEHARLAISNFDWDENTGGGIIKASNSSINNCKMAVCLNNYPNYTYFTPGTSQSNCIFDNVKFIKDDPRYEIDAGGYFTSWLIKGGVEIRNCTFRYSITSVPWQSLPYMRRASGINASATGLRVENSSFDGYRRGIYLNGYDGAPTHNALIYYNFFDHNSENITVDVDPYADIRGNVIRNMYPYLSRFSYMNTFGIYLNKAAGSYVGCGNSVSGTTDGGPGAGGTVNRLGLIANNNQWNSISVIDNGFDELSVGTQTQGYNYGLNIFCNTYNKNRLAWAVNPQSTNGYLNDQGTSCAPSLGVRAGNRFTANNYDIISYMSTSYNNWDYFAGSGAYENPFWSGQMTMNNCNTTANSQCNKPRACPVRFTTRLNHNKLRVDYNGLVNAGDKYSFEGRALQTEIVWGYNDLEDEVGLRTFLESENDDESRRLLIPMYVNAMMVDEGINAINALSLSVVEKQAYLNYYTIMLNLKQENRTIHQLTQPELELVREIAASEVEVSQMALGLLEYAYAEDRELPVEQLPMDPMSKKIKIPETPGRQPSTLADAAPNPAQNNTLIIATVNAADAVQHPHLIIRNSSGTEVWRTKLQVGENRVSVPVKSWQAGVYFYNLELDNHVIVSKKLSVIQ